MALGVSIIGSTGSIGTQSLDVLNTHKSAFKVLGLSAGSNIELLANQIKQFSPVVVSVKDFATALKLKKSLGKNQPKILWGEEGNVTVATLPGVEKVLVSSLGFFGIYPTLEAIKRKKTIALATKEVLVSAGRIIIDETKKNKVNILPVDSEHSAIFQCLEGRSIDEVSKIYLTCSGGPFRGMKSNDLKKVNLTQALNHPRWKMGKKITVDSATLMNKGLEAIEAHWLFGVPMEKIKVIVHPESIIHSAVEFVDGAIIAQMGAADMRLPIQYALFYPQKRQKNNFSKFSFTDYSSFHFEEPDTKTFRCLALSFEAIKVGGTAPAVLNAANDIAVESFLMKKLPFYKISEVVEEVLNKQKIIRKPNFEQIMEADKKAREFTINVIEKL